MDNINLTLKPFHLPALIDAVKARRLVLENDTTASAKDKAVIADLERRADLLHVVVTSEATAKAARRAYNDHVKRARHMNRQQKQNAQEAPQEPPHATQEAPEPSASIVKRHI